jgi:hypothetical protein
VLFTQRWARTNTSVITHSVIVPALGARIYCFCFLVVDRLNNKTLTWRRRVTFRQARWKLDARGPTPKTVPTSFRVIKNTSGSLLQNIPKLGRKSKYLMVTHTKSIIKLSVFVENFKVYQHRMFI